MKRTEALQPLSHDHFEGLKLAGEVERMLGAGETLQKAADTVCRFSEEHLVRHFALEEELLVDLCERIGGGALASRMLDEHRLLLGDISRIVEGDNLDTNLLHRFAGLLRAHIRFEERELFPFIERAAPPEALLYLGKRLLSPEGGRETL